MKKKNQSGEYEFGIYEVYYDDNGNVEGWTENPLVPESPTVEGLFKDLTVMMEAFKKDVLNYDKD